MTSKQNVRRAEFIRPSLDGRRFDIAVIGGGINGVAIARECARAGRQTLLLEQNDFSSGTTSRSTRIIHGGLRYLEHGELGLVAESLRERQRLLSERPHLVRPRRFLLALPPEGNRSALAVRAALWAYRWFGGSHASRGSGSTVSEFSRQLDAGRRWLLFPYEDAQCEFPERLVAEWLAEACQAGTIARNYAEALEIEVRDGRALSLVFRDQLDGTEQRVEATHFINATGPWVDQFCQRASLTSGQRLVGGIRGSHVVLPTFPNAPKSAVYSEAADGRGFFVIPWNEQLLVGTTEVQDDGDPGTARPSPTEIDYLLHSFTALFPHHPVTTNDVRYAFAGIRPLPYAPGREYAAITRRAILHDHAGEGAAGLMSVVGGKLTTAASLARRCVGEMGISVKREPLVEVAIAPADGLESSLRQWGREISCRAQISEASARVIAEWHGRRAMCVARLAASAEPLRARLCEHSSHLAAEAVAAVQYESAVHLGDILLRRVPVALGACWSAACSRTAAERIGKALDWASHRMEEELEGFENERQQFLQAAVGRRDRRLEAMENVA
jgi:glycerol-3-phosphate dehydrogenase